MKISQHSIMSLLLEPSAFGNTLSTATGFVLTRGRRDFLITNRHVVTGRHQDTGALLSKTTGATPDSLAIYFHSTAGLGKVIRTEVPLFSEDTPRWVEHPKLGPAADFVALPLTPTWGVTVYPYDTLNTGFPLALSPTDPVSVIGFPFGLTAGRQLAVWTTGSIASEPDIDVGGLPVMLIDSRTRHGQSGSPVIAYHPSGAVVDDIGNTHFTNQPVARFLGIYSGRVNEESDLGKVWKAAAIAELLNTL